MPKWLSRSIIGMSIAIAVVTTAQWASCRFYVLPSVWPWYARYSGTQAPQKISLAPMGCEDADGRTITVMMTILTTLISLSRNAD
jgi:hypothetical protein